MDQFAGKAALKAAISPRLAAAAEAYGGLCASAACEALAGLFGTVANAAVLDAGLGICCGGAAGPAQTAHAGAAMFMACAARQNGQPQGATIAICQKWQRHCQALPEDKAQATSAEKPGPAADILVLAYYFIMQNGRFFGLDGPPEKPRQYYDNIYADRESMFGHSPYALEEKLSRAVTNGNEALALATLREINAHGEKAVLAKNPLRSVKNSLIGSIAFLARASIQAGVSANDAFALSDALTQRVEEMGDRRAVLDFEEHILLQFIALVHRRLEESYSPPIVRVMHYVENHLDAKVSLPAAAAYAGVHPAYLSARFKRETGLPFTGYVAARKIQESSYFVRHTNYPISQIASLYGFSSQSYYITTFKKVLATTPMEYRRQLLAE